MISIRTLAISGAVIAVALAAFAAPFASTAPDGLERVAAENGLETAKPRAKTVSGLAGALGTVAVLGLGLVVARAVTRRRAP